MQHHHTIHISTQHDKILCDIHVKLPSRDGHGTQRKQQDKYKQYNGIYNDCTAVMQLIHNLMIRGVDIDKIEILSENRPSTIMHDALTQLYTKFNQKEKQV